MHLDYRFYVKFRNDDLWRECLETISMESIDGEEYSLLEISKVFNTPRLMMKVMEPIGMIFDTVTASEEETFCFIHDHKKSKDFFFRFTDYLFNEILEIAADDVVMIADLTDYDNDIVGDYIFYYLGGGREEIKQCIVNGPEGLDHHDIEVSNFEEMLKFEILTDTQKAKLQELTGGKYPINLMDSLRMSTIVNIDNTDME